RILPDAAYRIIVLCFAQTRDVSEALLPLLVDIDNASSGFEKLRQPRGVVADVVYQTSVNRRRGVVTFGLQALVISLIISQIELDQTILARNRVPLLSVEWRLDQRIGIVAQSPFIIGIFEGRRFRFWRRRTPSNPVVDTIGYQRFVDFAEIAVRASAEHSHGSEQQQRSRNVFSFQRRRRIIHRSRFDISAQSAATPSTTCTVARIGLKSVRPIGTTLDTYDR